MKFTLFSVTDRSRALVSNITTLNNVCNFKNHSKMSFMIMSIIVSFVLWLSCTDSLLSSIDSKQRKFE